uniref:Uncharacterized protein n=1 Tax=Rhizophora mucronata TaxID=61149 RepID=A0A2P2ISN7_RHIMU
MRLPVLSTASSNFKNNLLDRSSLQASSSVEKEFLR